MCTRKIPNFELCSHSGAIKPSLIYIDSSTCITKSCANPGEEFEDHLNEKCFDCIGVEPIHNKRQGSLVFFRHCFQAFSCSHEYEHLITDIERETHHPNVVLVTPILCLCPACKRKGYGTDNPPPKTTSIVPKDFQNLPRADMATILSGASVVPESSRQLRETSRGMELKRGGRAESSKEWSHALRTSSSALTTPSSRTPSRAHNSTTRDVTIERTTPAPPANAPSLPLYEVLDRISMALPFSEQHANSARKHYERSSGHHPKRTLPRTQLPGQRNDLEPAQRTPRGHSVYPRNDITTLSERMPVFSNLPSFSKSRTSTKSSSEVDSSPHSGNTKKRYQQEKGE